MLQQNRLMQLQDEIEQVTPNETMKRMESGAYLIDIRDTDELAQGSPVKAIRISRSFLEQKIENIVADSNAQILVMCASGVRSIFAADALKNLGYKSVASVKGGFQAWTTFDLPVEKLRILSSLERERYARHLMIPEVGEAGQALLLSSRVALVGAGGLGSPLAYYLAAAGVGTLGLIDDDVLERSNLQRQILHTDSRVGDLKTRSAAETLKAFNPDIIVETHELRLNRSNVDEILSNYDLVIDGSDNIETRYIVNDASLKLGIPMIYGAIFRFDGQISAFWPSGPQGGPCYRCLFPDPPPSEFTPSCAEAGVLGVLPGVIGTIMATEALKILLGIGEPLIGRLVNYNALEGRYEELQVSADSNCKWCSSNHNT